MGLWKWIKKNLRIRRRIRNATADERTPLTGPSQPMPTPTWYVGPLEECEAERVLQEEENGDGTFLVRECVEIPGLYDLCVKERGQIFHNDLWGKVIDNTPTWRLHLGKKCFSSLDQLIEYHKRYEILEWDVLLRTPWGEEPAQAPTRLPWYRNILHF